MGFGGALGAPAWRKRNRHLDYTISDLLNTGVSKNIKGCITRSKKVNDHHLFYCQIIQILNNCFTLKQFGTHSRPESGRWRAVFPGLTGAVPHHLTVDGAADTVVQLHIELGQNISCRADKGTDENMKIQQLCNVT